MPQLPWPKTISAPRMVNLLTLWIALRGGERSDAEPDLWQEILLIGSAVLLIGFFAIRAITGQDGPAGIESFMVAPRQSVHRLFLLDMGLAAGRGLRAERF